MKEKNLELLEEINKTLKEINVRQKIEEQMADSNQTLAKIDRRVENSTYQIQNSFDRIHDKVFNFNNILIATYVVLGTFPSENPILKMWTVSFPIGNLIFLIWLEIRQMGIHRLAANEEKLTPEELKKYGNRINSQTLLSLLAFGLTLACLIYLIIKIV